MHGAETTTGTARRGLQLGHPGDDREWLLPPPDPLVVQTGLVASVDPDDDSIVPFEVRRYAYDPHWSTGRRDPHKERHLIDFAVLVAMVTRADRISEQLTPRDRRYLLGVLGALEGSRGPWGTIYGSQRAAQALGEVVRRGGTRGAVFSWPTGSRASTPGPSEPPSLEL